MSVFPITAGPGSTGQWPGATYDCEAGGGGPGAQVTRQPAAVTQHASVARTLCRWCCAYAVLVTVASSRLATVRTTRCAWPASAVCRGRTYSTSVPASRRTTRRANPALHTHTLIYKC